MKPIAQQTAKWAPLVLAELQRQGIPLPTELILAVMDVESQGVTGLVNPKSGASGLMQVMPGTLQHYNNSNAVKFSLSDLRSRDNPAAQIRVGIWVLGQYWRAAYDYLSRRLSSIPMDELAESPISCTLQALDSVRRILNKLPVPNYESIKERYPKWNALPHPENVFERVSTASISDTAINSWVLKSAKSSIRPPDTGATDRIMKTIFGIVFGYVVSYFMKEIGKK